MRIKTLRAENFLSFGEAEFNFLDAGLVLVEGENCDDPSAKSNGSGKSAMIDALVWCLFGKTLRGYENDEVVNRRVGDDCLVEVEIENDFGGAFTITRARRHGKLKNALRVKASSGELGDMSGPSNTETQAIVERLLGCTMQTFLSSVVFGQDSAYRFSSLTDKEQKEILDEVLGVERFSVACDAARLRYANVSRVVGDTKLAMDQAEDSAEKARIEAAEMIDKDESFETERKFKLSVEREKIKKANDWLKKLEPGAYDKLKASADKAAKIYASLEDAVSRAAKVANDAVMVQVVADTKVDDLQGQVADHGDRVGACRTCGQKTDARKHASVLADLKDKLNAARKAMEKVDAEVAAADKQLVAAKRALSDAKVVATDAQKEVNENAAQAAEEKLWRRRVVEVSERVAELEKETNPYYALARKAESRRNYHESECRVLSARLVEEEAKLKVAEFWIKAFGAKGLRSLLLDSSLPILNEKASSVSQIVTGGAITIEFNATSDLKSGKTVDKFEVKVDNKHGAGSYLGNSAGERAKVDLCVGLALQQLVASRASASFNLCFFDEIFDHLDSAAHERVVEVLSEIDKESVYVVSHNDDLKSWFPSTLLVRKKNGFSTVEES